MFVQIRVCWYCESLGSVWTIIQIFYSVIITSLHETFEHILWLSLHNVVRVDVIVRTQNTEIVIPKTLT